MTFHLLSAIVEGFHKTMLVSVPEFQENESDPSAFFVPGAVEPKDLGTVEIIGEAADHIDETYISD